MKRKISFVIALFLILCIIPFSSFADDESADISNPFNDIGENDYYYDYVIHLYKEGYILGTSGNTYSPMKYLTRAELVQMLYNVNNKLEITPSVSGYNVFIDVKDSDWYSDAVKWAYYSGITAGTGVNTFSPDRIITREEAATLIYNLFFDSEFDNTDAIQTFTDKDNVSDFAYDAISYIASMKIITGYPDGSFQPKTNIERSMVSIILSNAVNVYTA